MEFVKTAVETGFEKATLSRGFGRRLTDSDLAWGQSAAAPFARSSLSLKTSFLGLHSTLNITAAHMSPGTPKRVHGVM